MRPDLENIITGHQIIKINHFCNGNAGSLITSTANLCAVQPQFVNIEIKIVVIRIIRILNPYSN